MIKSKKDLKEVITLEKQFYMPKRAAIENLVTSDNKSKIFKFIKLLRKTEYHHNNKGILHKFLYIVNRRKKNILGRKLGIEIWDNSFDSGLLIYHAGNIVVNGAAKIGKNCKLHGSNCIGNNGIKGNDCPIIGDNCRIGVGAKIIGNVRIASNITIAAGAVVVDSFEEEGITIGGVPARKIK